MRGVLVWREYSVHFRWRSAISNLDGFGEGHADEADLRRRLLSAFQKPLPCSLGRRLCMAPNVGGQRVCATGKFVTPTHVTLRGLDRSALQSLIVNGTVRLQIV